MKSFSDLAKKVELKSAKPTTEWQELGKEIQQHYKKPLYWLIAPWKDQIWYVRQIFKECQKGDKPVQYFIKILKLRTVKDEVNGKGNSESLHRTA